MSHLPHCNSRKRLSRMLLGTVLVAGVLAIGFADDKQTKRHHPQTPPTERVARVERSTPRPETARVQHSPRTDTVPTARSLNGESRGNSTFTPDFSREPQRVKLQPTSLNVPTTSTPRNVLATPNRIAFAEKGNKLKGEDKERQSKPEKPQPREPRPEQPKPEQPKPVKPMNDPPKVVIPKVEKPVVERVEKSKPVEQPKIEHPQRSKGPAKSGEMENKAGGPIRIRKTPNEKPGVEVVPNPANNATGKVRIKVPQPDTKVNHPATKNPGENVARHVDKSARLKDGATLSRDHKEQIKRTLDKERGELAKQGKVPDPVKVKLPSQTKMAAAQRLERLPRESLKLAVPKNGKVDPAVAAKLKLRPAHEVLNTRLKNGDFQHLGNLKSGHTFNLNKQFQLHQHGDVGRRLNLAAGLQQRGGWRHRHFGPISPIYSRHCRSMWYAGPSFCSSYVWYPSWSPWVDWCWWDTCAPIYDPRPIYCQPIVYDPCTPWVAWQFPAWQPLPYVTCGTWVDVDPVVVNSGIDLQLLATRFVDPGHPDSELGPRFRVWIRNNSSIDMNQAFNVLLIASNDANAYAGLPEAGVRVVGLRAGETQAIDIRLPYAANTMGRDSAGRSVPFTYLTALVDSHNELPETFEANNGATLIRGDILPVDPAAFAAEPGSAQPNGIIHVAGEGLGPEPGQAMVVIGDQEFQAEILGWFDLGIQIKVPDFDLDSATAADLIIIRGDGAASNPLTIEIDPSTASGPAPEAPAPELPNPPPLPEPAF